MPRIVERTPPRNLLHVASQISTLPQGEGGRKNMLSTLNRRVTLEAQTLTSDGGGGYSASWDTFAMVWAAIEPVSGTSVFGPDATEASVKYRVSIRRRTDVFAGMRVNDGGRLFEIKALLDDGPQSQFLVLATEKIG